MRAALGTVILLILLPIPLCALSSPGAALPAPAAACARIVEVMPRFPYEYVGIVNLGTEGLPLAGWSLSDGEGSWTISTEAVLAPLQEAYLCSNLSFALSLHPQALALDPNQDALRKGRLALADEGDEVLLQDPQGLVSDVLAYGKSTFSGQGWRGAFCPPPPEGRALRRSVLGEHSDSDTSADWTEFRPGRSDLSSGQSLAEVEPFLCPEDMRHRILREAICAQRSIDAAVYELTDREVASALVQASIRGVQVRVLVEGQPVGGMPAGQASLLTALARAGCAVFSLSSWHGFKRYDYLHCKFMVVDGRRTLVTSENWARGSLDSNRGWGVCVDSPPVAAVFAEAFAGDIDSDMVDVRAWSDGAEPAPLPPSVGPPLQGANSYPARVATVLAPDHAYQQVLQLLRGASHRLYLELFYASASWPAGLDLVGEVLGAARRGASVRVLLDASWYNSEDGGGNLGLASWLNQAAAREGLDLQAKLVSPLHGFTTLHNKGLIADQTVLVSSINWASSAFSRNREAALAICSPDVAAYFSECFHRDWADDLTPPALQLKGEMVLREGEELCLIANATDDGSVARILWDLGSDGTPEGQGAFFVARLPAGRHTLRVTALDLCNNSRSLEVEVCVLPRERGLDIALPAAMVAAAGAASMILLRKRVKRR